MNPGPNNSSVDTIFKEPQIEYSDGEESACNAGDLGSIPGLGRSPGEGNGNPFQYSFFFFFFKRISSFYLPGEFHGQRRLVATVHGVAKSPTCLSD